jgi:putative phosphoribosyl transferase
MTAHATSMVSEKAVEIPVGPIRLGGTLALPAGARGIVVFAHGSGSSRSSPRNTYVSRVLQAAGFGTVLFDLLTVDEDRDRAARFDIPLLAERLEGATEWLRGDASRATLPVGYFGASTGAAAALVAAARPSAAIAAVVSRGGRPDLAGAAALERVAAPTLLIVGGEDHVVITMNRDALAHLRCEKELAIVPGATHLFEEAGTLEAAAALAAQWFTRWLPRVAADPLASR